MASRIACVLASLDAAATEKAVIETLWEHLVPGAVVVLGDYGWSATKAQHDMWNDFARKVFAVIDREAVKRVAFRHASRGNRALSPMHAAASTQGGQQHVGAVVAPAIEVRLAPGEMKVIGREELGFDQLTEPDGQSALLELEHVDGGRQA